VYRGYVDIPAEKQENRKQAQAAYVYLQQSFVLPSKVKSPQEYLQESIKRNVPAVKSVEIMQLSSIFVVADDADDVAASAAPLKTAQQVEVLVTVDLSEGVELDAVMKKLGHVKDLVDAVSL
jgi:hypothetical protein